MSADFEYEKLEFDFPLLESQTSQLEADIDPTGDGDTSNASSRSKKSRRRNKNKEDPSKEENQKALAELRESANNQKQVNGGDTNGCAAEPKRDPEWQKLEPDTQSGDSYLTGTGVWAGKSADEVQREILEKPAPPEQSAVTDTLPTGEAQQQQQSQVNAGEVCWQTQDPQAKVFGDPAAVQEGAGVPVEGQNGPVVSDVVLAGGEDDEEIEAEGGAAVGASALAEPDSQQPKSDRLVFFAQMDLERFAGPNPCRLLHALTMSSANDFFNLERLETMGDSMLKFAVTTHLYAEFAKAHEGKLSQLRSQQVSNVNLHRLGVRRALPAAIVSTKFEPTENWLPPGFAVILSQSSHRQETQANQSASDELAKQQAAESEMARYMKVTEDLSGLLPFFLQVEQSLVDKCIADAVEALIGCYLTSANETAALRLMQWFGLRVHNEEQQQLAHSVPTSPLLRFVPEFDAQVVLLTEGLEQLEQRLRYRFRDRGFLLQALSHASFYPNAVTDCYQRLELLGDAILDYVITRHIYEDSKKLSPGKLTDLRSSLVNNNIFATLAVKWEFHKHFKYLSPHLYLIIDRFIQWQEQLRARRTECDCRLDAAALGLDSASRAESADDEESALTGLENEAAELLEGTIPEDIEVPKALGDIFESVAGAIYLDSGCSLSTVWRVYSRLMRREIERYAQLIPKSAVRELLELAPEAVRFERPKRTQDGKVCRCYVLQYMYMCLMHVYSNLLDMYSIIN